MNYALLPFPTFSKETDYAGRPDIRSALASREGEIAPNAISHIDLLNHVVEALRELPWEFAVDHCHEQDGKLHLAVWPVTSAAILMLTTNFTPASSCRIPSAVTRRRSLARGCFVLRARMELSWNASRGNPSPRFATAIVRPQIGNRN